MFKNTKNYVFKHVTLYAVLGTGVFLLVCAFGEGLISTYGSNAICNRYLGCNAGFFGFDLVEHFLFGVCAIWVLVWFFKKFPEYSLFTSTRWKNIVILLAFVVFVSVLWEIVECVYDVFRFDILWQPLLNFKIDLHILAQPTNLDTMGDLSSGAIGALVALFFIET